MNYCKGMAGSTLQIDSGHKKKLVYIWAGGEVCSTERMRSKCMETFVICNWQILRQPTSRSGAIIVALLARTIYGRNNGVQRNILMFLLD